MTNIICIDLKKVTIDACLSLRPLLLLLLLLRAFPMLLCYARSNDKTDRRCSHPLQMHAAWILLIRDIIRADRRCNEELAVQGLL